MSVWTVASSGDRLTIDDSLPLGRHRDEVVSAYRSKRDELHVRCVGGRMRDGRQLPIYQVEGPHFTLETIVGVDRGLFFAAFGDWTEEAA